MMKINLLFLMLLFASLTNAQTRTGTGPDDGNGPTALVDSFIAAINEKSEKCPGGKTKFKNLSEFRSNYIIAEVAQKHEDPTCIPGSIPPRFLCLLKGPAAEDLDKLVKRGRLSTEVNTHGEVNKLSHEERRDISNLLFDIHEKLSTIEKK